MSVDKMFLTVSCSCGHTASIDFFGNPFEIDEQHTYIEKHGQCPTCMMNKYKKQAPISFEDAMVDAGRRRLPQLFGFKFEDIQQGVINRAMFFNIDNKTLWHIFLQEERAIRSIAPAHNEFMDHEKWPYPLNACLLKDLLWGEACMLQHSWWWISHGLDCAGQLCNSLIWRIGGELWDQATDH